MAAGQQRKRLTSSSPHEPFKARKKKKLDTSDASDLVLNLRPHIDLSWDEKYKKVMPKRDQVGLAWKDLAPFVESIPKPCKGLADVIQVPKEIFGLKDLSSVLSYEVWSSCLSESDRKLLSQFLPSGTGTDEAVESLLEGENLHFGNQFSDWSSSVCSGNLHPDLVRKREKEFRSNKKAYYSEISKYHCSMIDNLESWKEKWQSSKDPEKLFRDSKPNKQKQSTITEKSKVIKKEIPPKIVQTSDASKYMSIIKISSAQFEKIKNLKQSGDGIQQKLLTPFLGDIKKLNAKSYESVEDEEKKLLHDHWLQVAKKDIPLAFNARKERKFEIEEFMKSLCLELSDREISRMNEEDEEEKSLRVELNSDNQLIPEEEEVEEEGEEYEDEDPQEDEQQPQEDENDSRSDSETDSKEDSGKDSAELEEEQVEEREEEKDESEEMEEEDINMATNIPSYRNDLERIPSLNTHHHEFEPERDDSLMPVIPSLQTEEIPQIPLPVPTNSDKWGPVDTYTPQYFPHHQHGTVGTVSTGTSAVINLEREVMGMDNNSASLFCPELIPQSNFLSLPSRQAEQQRLMDQRQRQLFLQQTQPINKPVQVQPQPPVYQTNSYASNHMAQIAPHHQRLNITNSATTAPRFAPPGYNTWFPQDHHHNNNSGGNNNAWVGMDTSSASSDGSLFSVLSECNKIPPRVQQYQSGNFEQYAGPRNFGMNSVMSNNNNGLYGYLPSHMGNINNGGAGGTGTGGNGVSGTMDSLAWTNYGRQNSNLNHGMQDNMGRPFSRPWER